MTRRTAKGRPAMDITRPIMEDVNIFGDLRDELRVCVSELRDETNLRFFPLMAAPYIEKDGKEWKVGAIIDFAPRYDVPLDLQKIFYDLAMDVYAQLDFNRVQQWSEKCGFGRMKPVMLDGDLGNSLRLPTLDDLKAGAIIGEDPGKDTIRGSRQGFELVERYTSKIAAERVAHEIAKIVSFVYNIEVGKGREAAIV
jgi:hypothetical protein